MHLLLRTAIALLLAAPGAFPAVPGPAGACGDPRDELLEPLERWAARVEARGLELEDLMVLRQLLLPLRGVTSGEEARAVDAALLDLSVAGLERLPGPGAAPVPGLAGRLQAMAFEELRERAAGPGGDAFLERLVTGVLIDRRDAPLLRRYAALELLDAERTTSARVAMLHLARDGRDPLRPAVLATLPGWPGEDVDLFLVSLLGKPWPLGARPHPFNLVLERLREDERPLGQRAQAALEERIALMLLSTDWRDASRGLELARGLDPLRAVPMLLDALSSWNRREARGMGSLRIASDIQRELRRISGRKIGLDARSWVTWWIAVRQGRIPLHAPEADGESGRTSADFFGLRPVSDRVVFVLDASGSMDQAWATSGHSRYVEAVEQMTTYLQAAGEETRFNVVLFSSGAVAASTELLPATTENLEKVRTSLLARRPDGSTLLRPAIHLALGAPDGRVDPERVEVDTVVVLCDGETASGPGWVVPFLDGIRAEVRVVFHCVLLATGGDGTLEALARETGGELLRVGG